MASEVAKHERAVVEAQIRRILLRHSHADLTEDTVLPHTALIDTGFELSSVDLLEALVEVEQTLHLRLTDESLTVEVLSSFTLFVDHVCKLSPQASGSRSTLSRSSPA
jgi:acyl carrier protein